MYMVKLCITTPAYTNLLKSITCLFQPREKELLKVILRKVTKLDQTLSLHGHIVNES